MAALGTPWYRQSIDPSRARALNPFLKHCEGIFITGPLSNVPESLPR